MGECQGKLLRTGKGNIGRNCLRTAREACLSKESWMSVTESARESTLQVIEGVGGFAKG